MKTKLPPYLQFNNFKQVTILIPAVAACFPENNKNLTLVLQDFETKTEPVCSCVNISLSSLSLNNFLPLEKSGGFLCSQLIEDKTNERKR